MALIAAFLTDSGRDGSGINGSAQLIIATPICCILSCTSPTSAFSVTENNPPSSCAKAGLIKSLILAISKYLPL